MRIGETGSTIKVDMVEFRLLAAHKAPVPLAILIDEDNETSQVMGAEYPVEDLGLLANAVTRAKEQAMETLYPNAEALASENPQERKAANAEIQKAVFYDDGSRSKLMRTAIVSANMLSQIAELRQ